jgi:hypothetical protein
MNDESKGDHVTFRGETKTDVSYEDESKGAILDGDEESKGGILTIEEVRIDEITVVIDAHHGREDDIPLPRVLIDQIPEESKACDIEIFGRGIEMRSLDDDGIEFSTVDDV